MFLFVLHYIVVSFLSGFVIVVSDTACLCYFFGVLNARFYCTEYGLSFKWQMLFCWCVVYCWHI